MKGFVIKNLVTGKYFIGNSIRTKNPNYDSGYSWIGDNSQSTFLGYRNLFNPAPTKQVTEADKERWPMFYRKGRWSFVMEEVKQTYGSDGTKGPPWMEYISCYWGPEPKVFTTKKAADRTLSVITKTNYRDRNDTTKALLYLPTIVHDYKIVNVEVTTSIVEVDESGTAIAKIK